jgi:hypothetical protein
MSCLASNVLIKFVCFRLRKNSSVTVNLALGYNWDHDHMDWDILAVSDETKADPRSIQLYLRRQHEKYPVT